MRHETAERLVADKTRREGGVKEEEEEKCDII